MAGMIAIRNARGVTPKLDVGWTRRTLRAVVAGAGYGGWDVGIRNVSPAAMAALNKQYRGKDAVTDILSFANYTLPRPEAFPPGLLGARSGGAAAAEAGAAQAADVPLADTALLDTGKDLGDLVVCASYIAAYCAGAGIVDCRTHWRVLLVHGVTHLLGYDHEVESDATAMAAREARIAATLHALPLR